MTSYSRPLASIAYLVPIACLLGFTAVFGVSIIQGDGQFDQSLSILIARSIAASCFAAILFFLLNSLVVGFKSRSRYTDRRHNIVERLTPKLTPKSIMIATAIMLLLWLPWIIALYPASMNWDTYYQMWMWYPESHPLLKIPWSPTQSFIDSAFTDHHPIFDTIVYGAFALVSDMLTGSWNAGVFIFAATQTIGTATALVCGIAYAHERGCPPPACFISLLFCSIMPFFPAYSMTMLKDSFFSWLFLPWIVILAEICYTKGEILKSKKFALWLILLTILLCLTKKTGFYVVLFTILIFAIVFRHYWKPLALAGISAILLMQVILPIFIFTALDVAPGGKQEMLAPLFQQTARYTVFHGNDITEEERSAIDAVLGYDTLVDRYDPFTADPVKNGYNWQDGDKYIRDYLLAWINMGVRHPLTYLEATLATNAPYISPVGSLEIHENTGDIEHGGSDMLKRPTCLDGFRNAMISAYHNAEELPLFGTLFQVVLYAWWIPLFWLYSAFYQKSEYLPLTAVLFVSIASCLITPVFHARYALPLIYSTPFFVCLLLAKRHNHTFSQNVPVPT